MDTIGVNLIDLEKESKARAFLTKAFFAVCLLTLGSFYIIGMINMTPSRGWLAAIFGVAFAALGLLIGFLIHRNADKITNRKLIILSAVAAVMLVFLQVMTIYYLSVEPSWDFGGVFVSAREYVERGRIITHEHYFERFSNNTGILAIEIVFFKLLNLLGIPVQYYHGSFLNILFIDAAVLFMLLFVRKVWGNARALMFLIIAFCFTPYILYAPIYYTDSISMIFISLPLYLFACALKCGKTWQKIVLLVSISLLLSMGTKTKGTVAILLVALLIYIIFNFDIKKIIASILLLVIPFLGFSLTFDYAIEAKGIIKKENIEQIKFPPEYWLYMGLNTETSGGFNQSDFDEIYAAESYSERQEIARAGISERLSDFGFAGILGHIADKAAYTYRDGTYFISVMLSRQPLKDLRLLQIFRMDGQNSFIYYAWADAYHAVILALLITGMILGLRKRGFDITAMLYTALFGLALFLMIWETRSRYIFNYTPIMLALAGNSILEIFEFIKTKIKGARNDESDLHSAQQFPD